METILKSILMIYFYHTVAKIPSIQHEISCDVISLRARKYDQLYHGSAHECAIMHLLMLMQYCILHAHEPGITKTSKTRIPRKALSHLLGQKSQEPQSERDY